MSSTSAAPGRRTDAWFVTTHWSVVLSARDQASLESDQALEKLCRTYWCPLYAFVRRQGHNPADAQDLTQEFFSRHFPQFEIIECLGSGGHGRGL